LRLIVLLLLVLGAFLVYKSLTRKPPPRSGPSKRAPVPPERMVTCAHCGLRLPESDSVSADGRTFCCEEHRRLAR
jgi:uncharacterized protein